MRFSLPVPKIYFVAIGQKNERHIGLLCIASALFASISGIDAFTFGFHNGKSSALATAEHVVRAITVRQSVFVTNAGAVADLPVLVTELRIDQRAGKGFGLFGH